jgi:hypothetical protein
MDSLIDAFENTQITIKVSDIFMNEMNYICNYICNYYAANLVITVDVLDILSHEGFDLACDMSYDYELDCKWFKLYGSSYIFNYITTRIDIKTREDFLAIHETINNIKQLYEIV